MVFLIDKYKVDTLSKVFCHKPIYRSLLCGYNNTSNLTEWEHIPNIDDTQKILSNITTIAEFYNFAKCHFKTNNVDANKYALRYIQMPNLLIYGPVGCGKKTLIKLLLEDIYDKKIHETKPVTYQISGYGNSTTEVVIEQSNYHMIIEPTNSGLDKYIIHEIVKEYAKQTILNVCDCKTSFRVVFINNVDNLSYYAQTSLRCTMEQYHKTCKFILCGYQLSKIIEPLRSRCLNVRIPCPTIAELSAVIFDISCRENIHIDSKNIMDIVIKSNGNIKKAIMFLELYSVNITNYTLSWKKGISDIVDIIVDFEKNPSNTIFNNSNMQKIRIILYLIFVSGINKDQIAIELLKYYISKSLHIDPKLNTIVLQLFGYYETRINKGNRMIIHIETLISSILYHIATFKLKTNILKT